MKLGPLVCHNLYTSGLFYFVKSMNKNYRLKKSHDIEKLVKKRKSVGNIYYAIYFNQSSINKTRVAISVSKKIGNAVTRNKEKRIIREIIRNNIDIINILDILIVERKMATQLSYQEKEVQIVKLLNKLNRKETNNEK